MKSTDLPAPSTLDRLRYGPSEAQPRSAGKPHPRIAELALILVILGCAIRIAGWRWGSIGVALGMMAWGILTIYNLRLAVEQEDLRRAYGSASALMMPLLAIGLGYMWLSADTPSWPRPVTGAEWQQLLIATFVIFNCLNQAILHHLIARKQVNGA